MLQKIKKTLRKFGKSLQKKIERSGKDSRWVDFMQMLVSAITLTTFCAISPILAEYQGKKAVYWTAVSVIILLLVIAVWELICLVGYDNWKKLFYGVYSLLRKAVNVIRKRRCSSRSVYLIPLAVMITACVLFIFLQIHSTKYYSSIVEVYGIPVGVGEPLSFEERKCCADYWKIEDYAFRRYMVITHEDSYHENEIMGQYSSIYNMAFFQPVDHMVYRYRKNKDKFQRLDDEKAYLAADTNGFREPTEISYYNSSGKLLLALKKDEDSDTFDILSYSVDSMPQLLNSTLLRIPEEEEGDDGETEERDEMISRNAIGNSIMSQEIEVTYNSDGLPETRRINPHIYNLYGVNGERYQYNEAGRMTALYYLDINGEPICNRDGVMMVSFEYGEDNRLTGVRYFSDENGEEKVEGFHGVFCEKYEYDSDGNLYIRKQLDQNENRWYDKNGVCEYQYTYDGGRLIREEFLDFSGNKAYHVGVKSTSLEFAGGQDDAGNKTISVLLDPVTRLSEQETAVPLEQTEENKRQENRQAIVSVMSDQVNKIMGGGEKNKEDKEDTDTMPAASGYGLEGVENGKLASEQGAGDRADSSSAADAEKADTESPNTPQTDMREAETPVRNYTEVRYTLYKKDRMLRVSYYNGNGRVRNERGFSAKQVNYDSKLRIKEKTYFDTEDKPCLTVDGYARVIFEYTSENGEEKESIEYRDDNKNLAVNRKEGYGYARVEYKPYEEEENRNGDYTVTLEYYDQNDALLCLPEEGYAKVRKTYNERGLLVRETYHNGKDEEEQPAYRKEYMVAGIDYEYSDDGNLICEVYKDASDRPMNRWDMGVAMKLQEFENGKLAKVHFKGYIDNVLQDVSNKKQGFAEVRYLYANGREVEAQYFDVNGNPVVRSDYGYAVRKKEYNNRGLLMAERFYGTDGEPILQKDNSYAAITYQYDELGRKNFLYFYGADEKPMISGLYYCAGMKYEYDDEGNRSDIRYLDENGNLMVRSDLGYAWIKRKYNADGKLEEKRYFDNNGQPVEGKKDGYACYKGFYEDKNLVRVEYRDRYDKLVLHKDYGYAIAAYRYNEQGKCIWENYFDANVQPVISKKYHCAGFQYEYDEEQNQETVLYLNLDGQVMIRSDLGYAKVVKQYDDFGHLVGEHYYDAALKPVLCKEGGYASFEDQYDVKGNCVRNTYWDAAGELTLRKDTGCAVIENKFDDFGRCIRVSYYGKDYDLRYGIGAEANQKALVSNAEYGCAGFRYQYDEAGNRTDICYTDVRGNVVVRRDLGFAKVHKEYDGQGNLVVERYYDADNNPTACREGGYASFQKKFKNGKCIEEAYYAADGTLVLRNDENCAVKRWQYDELGQCISEAFYDTKGQSIINKKYLCAMFEYAYDSRGYQTDIRYRDVDGKIMIRPDLGYAHIRKEYDDRGNTTMEFYYDEEGRFTLSKEGGIAYFEDRYDDNGNCVEGRAYGKNGELKIRKDRGYASFRNFYDKYGRWRAQYYYGVDGKTPLISTAYHCAGCQYEYDEMGDRTTTKYVGTDGELMIREDLGYAEQEIRTEYDSESNEEKEMGYFRDPAGEPAAKKEGGYTGYENEYICGNWVEGRYYTDISASKRELTEVSGEGYAIVRENYDEFGQYVSLSYYDAAGQPVRYLNKEDGTEVCAEITYEYDEKGNMVGNTYKDTDGSMMIRDDRGYAQVCSVYDEQGNITEERYYDTAHRPAADKQGGYYSVDWVYRNGNCIEERYYDVDKKLMLRSDQGYAIRKTKYDKYGQDILSSYFDTEEEPIANTWYDCAAFEYRYDKLGNKTDIIYRDTIGDMTIREGLGYAWIKWKYDEWGRKETETYYDDEGNPTTDVNGRAGIRYEYDEQGNSSEKPFDLNGTEIN